MGPVVGSVDAVVSLMSPMIVALVRYRSRTAYESAMKVLPAETAVRSRICAAESRSPRSFGGPGRPASSSAVRPRRQLSGWRAELRSSTYHGPTWANPNESLAGIQTQTGTGHDTSTAKSGPTTGLPQHQCLRERSSQGPSIGCIFC
jgi:hypothetical protein